MNTSEADILITEQDRRFAADLWQQAFTNTYDFMTKYSVTRRFSLNTFQELIFQHYFAGYIINKNGLELSRAARNPLLDLLSRVSTSKRIRAKNLSRQSEINDFTAQQLLTEADELSTCFRLDIESGLKHKMRAAYIKYGFEHPNINSKLYELLTVDGEFDGLVNKVVLIKGSPAAIRNAANVLSSVYLENQDQPLKAQHSAVEQTLSRITIRQR